MYSEDPRELFVGFAWEVAHFLVGFVAIMLASSATAGFIYMLRWLFM